MITCITVRELRANLGQYLDLLEQGETIEVRGLKICSQFTKIKTTEECRKSMRPFSMTCVEGNEPEPPPLSEEALERAKETFANLKGRFDVRGGRYEKSSDDAPLIAHRPEIGYAIEHGPCDTCKKRVQLYGFYDDGERKICEQCLKDRLGKNASRYLVEANKIIPQEPMRAPVMPLRTPVSKCEHEPVRYCSSCKCQAVYGNSSLCIKCAKKTRKK